MVTVMQIDKSNVGGLVLSLLLPTSTRHHSGQNVVVSRGATNKENVFSERELK